MVTLHLPLEDADMLLDQLTASIRGFEGEYQTIEEFIEFLTYHLN